MADTVELYEDGGGQLYLTCGEIGYADLEQLGAHSTFATDAAELLADDTDDWTLPQYPTVALVGDDPRRVGGPRLIAQACIHDGRVVVHGIPDTTIGAAGRLYLGPDAARVLRESGDSPD